MWNHRIEGGEGEGTKWAREREGGEGEGTKYETVKQNMGREESETVQQKERKNRKLKPWKQRVSETILVEKALGLGFVVELNLKEVGFTGGDRAQKYFIFISILKLLKTILKSI